MSSCYVIIIMFVIFAVFNKMGISLYFCCNFSRFTLTLIGIISLHLSHNLHAVIYLAYLLIFRYSVKLLLNAGSRINAGSLINAGVLRPMF